MSNDTPGGTPANDQPTPNDGGTPAGNDGQQLTWDGWIEEQPEEIRGLIDTHTSGLKSALDSERQQRKDLQKALKDVTKELEESSTAREALEKLQNKLATYEMQVNAYEALTAANVANVKLAYIAAREAGAVRKDGTVNMEALKSDYPELFKKPATPPANPGAGTGNGLPKTKDMNQFIRSAAGRS